MSAIVISRHLELVGMQENWQGVGEDKGIKVLYKKNPHKAFDLLVSKYMKLLFYHAYHMVKDYIEAQDISQEALLKAFQNEKLFSSDISIKSWLLKVISNQSIDHLRSKTTKEKYKEFSDISPVYNTPEDILLKNENKTRLKKSLAQLSPTYKNIIILRYFHELDYSEIASIMECKIGTVMSRLNRAKKILREEM